MLLAMDNAKATSTSKSPPHQVRSVESLDDASAVRAIPLPPSAGRGADGAGRGDGAERPECTVSGYERPPNTPRGPESAPGGLTARQSDGNVAHCGVGLGSVPVAFTRLDVSDVTDLDLKSLIFCGDPPAARGDN
jgi:hypothetical protein